jgi:hypothetical protein
VVAQENGKPLTERGQKMFMNSQSARIATVCLCLPLSFDYGYFKSVSDVCPL